MSGSNPVSAYLNAYRKCLTAFNCPLDYLIRPETETEWRITKGESMYLLHLGGRQFVTIRQEGKPLVYRAEGYALVIAIDCVRTAFLLDGAKELNN